MNTDPRDLPDWRLLDAWLAGSATPAERAEVEAWMRHNARNAVFVRELEAAIRQPVPATDLDRAWKATMEKARAREAERVIVLKRVRPAWFAPALAGSFAHALAAHDRSGDRRRPAGDARPRGRQPRHAQCRQPAALSAAFRQ